MNSISTEVIPSITRRDFLKLKSLLVFWFYLLNTFGINIFAEEKEDLDYDILDELLKLPFSDKVKKEIESRVSLQKKYCFDAGGFLHPLNRFFKEIGNFIVAQNNLEDYNLLNTLPKKHLNQIYLFNKASMQNNVPIIKSIQQGMIGMNQSMLNEALVHAINSFSVDTTTQLLRSKIDLNETSKACIEKVFTEKEYNIFYQKLTGGMSQPLIPSQNKLPLTKNIRTLPAKEFDVYCNFVMDDYRYTICYNSAAKLFREYIIDDFKVDQNAGHIYVSLWGAQDVKKQDLLNSFEDGLHQHNFLSFQEFEHMTEVPFKFGKHQFEVEQDEIKTDNTTITFDLDDGMHVEVFLHSDISLEQQCN